MKNILHIIPAFLIITLLAAGGCEKKSNPVPEPEPPLLQLQFAKIGSADAELSTQAVPKINYDVATNSVVKLTFNSAVDRTTVGSSLSYKVDGFVDVQRTIAYEKGDSVLVISPNSPLKNLGHHTISANFSLKSAKGKSLSEIFIINFYTSIDSSDKFPIVSDNTLLDTVQKRTFKYFWDFGHPVSGLARERSNATPETVTSGGSGFGIMTIPIAINRNFITRTQGLQRMQMIVGFLKNTAQKFHGAFPHWLNGTTGAVIPFSTKDNGADLVETSYLMAGLLTARQYFNEADAAETNLRNDINSLWNAVEWNWFRKSNENVLYWHWSPNFNWDMNHKIQGWNECLITYILAASSTTFGVPQVVYREGFARSGAMSNGNSYYGTPLPLGPSNGGPLFFSHYSFLGVNPNGLSDIYANYLTQVTNHTKINYEYCRNNPKRFFGYSSSCWGLTASDIPGGYAANEPNNDIGVISPTAALSSFPFAPLESMSALKFFYYKLGDKIFKDYGFVDAFSLPTLWFASSHLAIDQGPIIIMIENYRTGLIWNLLTSCPEIKNGMKNVLGFTAPYL